MVSDQIPHDRRKYNLVHFRRYEADTPDIDPHDPVDPSDPWYEGPSAEDFEPAPPKPKSPLSRLPDRASLRPVLLCFMLFWAVSLSDWRLPDADGLWASGEAVFQHHQYWRLFTALFDHANVGHLVANTPLFVIFGWYLRSFFGWLAFPLVPLLVGAASNLATIALYEPDARLVGASGMLYGMVALWLVLYVRFETIYPVGMRIFRTIGVALMLLFPTTFEKTTSYTAHATGFVIGLVAGMILCSFVKVVDIPQESAEISQIH